MKKKSLAKKTFVKPTLVEFGSIQDLTLGGSGMMEGQMMTATMRDA